MSAIDNAIFLHVPRTGGSSLWHSLVPIAMGAGGDICDIYHECKLRFGSPAFAAECLKQFQTELGDRKCLFHHHTMESIAGALRAGRTVYATVLRDPVDRFISEVNHCKTVAAQSDFRRCITSDGRESASYDFTKFVDYHEQQWGAEFVGGLIRDELSTEELLEIAVEQAYFRNYYVRWFSSLLETVPLPRAAGRPTRWDDIASLAAAIRSRVETIGAYEDLPGAFKTIAACFQLPECPTELQLRINVASSRPTVSKSDRERYVKSFELDYWLLEELGLCASSTTAT
jgi:hypothetical protein